MTNTNAKFCWSKDQLLDLGLIPLRPVGITLAVIGVMGWMLSTHSSEIRNSQFALLVGVIVACVTKSSPRIERARKRLERTSFSTDLVVRSSTVADVFCLFGSVMIIVELCVGISEHPQIRPGVWSRFMAWGGSYSVGLVAASIRSVGGRKSLSGAGSDLKWKKLGVWTSRLLLVPTWAAFLLAFGGVIYSCYIIRSDDDWVRGMCVYLVSLATIDFAAKANNHLRRSAHRIYQSAIPEFTLFLRAFEADGTLFELNDDENQVAEALARNVPMKAIGRPGEYLPPLGGERIYVDHEDDWQDVVRDLLKNATLVIIRAGDGDGLRTEFSFVQTIVDPSRCLVMTSSTLKTRFVARKDYEKLVESVSRSGVTWTFPEFSPRADFYAFDDNWNAYPLDPGFWKKVVLSFVLLLSNTRNDRFMRYSLFKHLKSKGLLRSKKPVSVIGWYHVICGWTLGALCLVFLFGAILVYLDLMDDFRALFI